MGWHEIAGYAGVVCIGLFLPAAVSEDAKTPASRARNVLTVLACIALPLATIVVTPVFLRVHAWRQVSAALRWLELAVVVFALMMMITLRVMYGAVERLFYCSSAAWLIVLGLHFARLR